MVEDDESKSSPRLEIEEERDGSDMGLQCDINSGVVYDEVL
jgi:hypothetical protein